MPSRQDRITRNYQKKTCKGEADANNIYQTYLPVKEKKFIFRKTAKTYNVKYQTLFKKYKAWKNKENVTVEKFKMNLGTKRIFNDAQEECLKQYLLTCAQINVGLMSEGVRVLAYEIVQRNNILVTEAWIEKQVAGVDWLTSFMKRHPDLSLRKPEGCSIARSSAFNRKNMGVF